MTTRSLRHIMTEEEEQEYLKLIDITPPNKFRDLLDSLPLRKAIKLGIVLTRETNKIIFED